MPLLGDRLLGGSLVGRVSTDGGVSLLVHFLNVICVNSVLDEPGELLLVGFLLFLLNKASLNIEDN